MKIYMVEEITWDGNVTVCCFSTKEKAVAFCHKEYSKYNSVNGIWDNYEIVEYEVDANSG